MSLFLHLGQYHCLFSFHSPPMILTISTIPQRRRSFETQRNENSDQIDSLVEEYKDKIVQLNTDLEDSKLQISDYREIADSRKCEIEKMDCVINSLKESNKIMKEHAQDSVEISEQYQQNLKELQENLQVTIFHAYLH